MKTMLIVIRNDADHEEAKALVGKLIGSNDPEDRARLAAQARLIEAYERNRWPRRAGPSAARSQDFLYDDDGLSK